MVSSSSGTSPSHPLQSLQINNEGNNGLIGDGSNNIVMVNSGDVIIPINDSENELDRLLDRYISKDALKNSFYSPLRCHPNTRSTVCNEIGQWIDESGSEQSPLLWLNGPVGVGKSSIAKTISVDHDQEVVATFFFSTSSDRSGTTLFPTLAWQLGRKIPDTREHIIASLKNIGSLQTSQIEEQFDLLILQPLKSTTTLSRRPVMVIDGIDECIDESMLVRFLRALVRTGEGDMPVRFMICSRPEPRIRTILARAHQVNPKADGQELKSPSLLQRVRYLVCGLDRSSDSIFEPRLHTNQARGFLQDVWELYRPIRLGFDKHDVPSSSFELADMLDRICPHAVISTIRIGFSEECKQDIEKYLTDIFNAIPPPGDVTSPWFQPSDISDLVEASCGQFLYASTIARLLDEPHIDPRDVLVMARRGSLPTPDLNKLYKVILKRAEDTMRSQAQDGGPSYRMEWQFVMDSLKMLVFFAGNVHFCTVPKTFPVIEYFLGLEDGKLTSKLGKMHSVLSIVPGESIRIHHRSFLEFLQSQERSGEYHIAFSTGLRQILILLGLEGLKYKIFKDHDSRRHFIESMVVACDRTFFGRSRYPRVLRFLHFIIHLVIFIIVSSLIFCSLAFIPFTHKSIQLVFLSCLSIIVHSLGFCISFVLSLTAYTFSFNRSFIVPFFNPFLHPLFNMTDGFLVPSKLVFYLLLTFFIPFLWIYFMGEKLL